MARNEKIDDLKGHLYRTRIFAWVFIIGFCALIAILIEGKGTLRHWWEQPEEAAWHKNTEFQLRSELLKQCDAAKESGDPVSAAIYNGLLASEARNRAEAVMHAWMPYRNEKTKLFPQTINNDEWNYRNTAADFFCFMITAAKYNSNQYILAQLMETLQAESNLAPPDSLCQPVKIHDATPIHEDHDELLFASSEYAKDGLISVYERYGDIDVYNRMTEVLSAILANSRVNSAYGPLPSTRSEPNGNILQVCSRFSYLTEGNSAWSDMNLRLSQAIISQMLSDNHGLPAHYYDFTNERIIESRTKLRDHGNELPVGLAEAYNYAVYRGNVDPGDPWHGKADEWAEPLTHMFELILAHGFNDEGLMGNALDPETLTLVDPRPNDNWGYLYTAMIAFSTSRQNTWSH